jgi:Ca-activated chloride channel homolog
MASVATGIANAAVIRLAAVAGALAVRVCWKRVAVALLVLAASPVLAGAGTLGLFAPTTAQTGAPFVVTFNGTPGPAEAVMFAFPGSSEAIRGEFNSFAPLIASPTTLYAPFQPGQYDLLYLDGAGAVAGRMPVTVTPARASLEVPETVAAGSLVSILWTGPAAIPDYIVFARPGAKSDSFVGAETADTTTNPTALRAPKEPGIYELRYVQRVLELHFILARKKVVVQ